MSSPPKRALIVIDVQNEYFDGGLPIEYPDRRRSLDNIGRAMDAAQARGIPVVVVQHLAAADSPLFARGSAGAALHPQVERRPHALHVQKSRASAFAGTGLGEWLQARAIDTLTVVGYMTHNCNVSTILEAAHAGLSVEFLADASGSVAYANRAGTASAEQIHRTVCIVLQSNFAAVLDTEEWLARLDSGELPQRDDIHRSHLAALRLRD